MYPHDPGQRANRVVLKARQASASPGGPVKTHTRLHPMTPTQGSESVAPRGGPKNVHVCSIARRCWRRRSVRGPGSDPRTSPSQAETMPPAASGAPASSERGPGTAWCRPRLYPARRSPRRDAHLGSPCPLVSSALPKPTPGASWAVSTSGWSSPNKKKTFPWKVFRTRLA